MRLEEIVEKQIHEQMGLIQIMGWEPNTIKLHPSLYKKMCDYWIDKMMVSEDQRKVMVSVSSYMGMPVVPFEGTLLNGSFLFSDEGTLPPVLVTYTKI